MIEAATEDEAIKREIYKTVIPSLRKDTIIASNTSSLSITRLGATTDRPEKFMGMHFMNPVPIMKLVEVINGKQTSESVTSSVLEAAERMGKIPLMCNDSPGFVSNRILCPMINEAILTLLAYLEQSSISNLHFLFQLQLVFYIFLDVYLLFHLDEDINLLSLRYLLVSGSGRNLHPSKILLCH